MSSTGDAGPSFNRHWIGVSFYSVDTPPQQKALSSVERLIARVGDGGPALDQQWVKCSVCWALPTISDAGPTLKQHCVNDSCINLLAAGCETYIQFLFTETVNLLVFTPTRTVTFFVVLVCTQMA